MTVRDIPRSLTTFIGRGEQIGSIRGLLVGANLVTLTGPGGSGKTRLATAIAEQWEGDGWFIDLVPVSADQVASSVVSAILEGRPTDGQETLEVAAGVVGDRRALLVLDNCEHVIDSVVTVVTDLVTRCPRLTALATSRESLGVEGEIIFAVPPMTHPDLRELPPPEGLLRYDAIALFADRLRRSAPQMHIGGAEAAVMARIVAKLDGLPLAIELAAARAQALSLEEIDDRLKDRFELLSGHSRTAADRHRTLRGAIEWSFSSLPDREAALLTRMTVFSGSFNLEAVEAICIDERLLRPEIVELVAGLIQRSFVVADTSGKSARYRLLETIREFALERLSGDEASKLRPMHRTHYIAVAHHAAQESGSPGGWDSVLDELPNFRAVAASAVADDDIDNLVDILDVTYPIWIKAWGGALLDLAERAVEGATTKPVEAALLAQRATLGAHYVGLLSRAEQFAAKARAHEAVAGQMPADYELVAGWASKFRGDREQARIYLERGLLLARDSGDRSMEAEILQAMGWVETDLSRGRALHEEALAILRSIGSTSKRIGLALARLANLASKQHDHNAVNELIPQLYEIGREYQDQEWVLDAGMRETRQQRLMGDLEAAKRAAELLIEEVDDDTPVLDVAWTWVEAARTLIECGDPARAERVAMAAVERIDEGALPYEKAELLCVAAVAAELLGRRTVALDLLRESHTALASTDDGPRGNDAESFGRVLLIRRHTEIGVKLIGVSIHRRPPCAQEVPLVDRFPELAHAREELGPERYEALLAEGAGLTPDHLASCFDEGMRLLTRADKGTVEKTATIDLSATKVVVSFQGAEATLPMSKGMRFLALLVAQPGREIHVAELTAAVDGAVADPHTTSAFGPALDQRAATELRKRARTLEAEIAEAREWGDEARADLSRIELEAIADHLSSAFGLGGRPRPQGDATERLRKAVWNRLNDAMEKVEHAHPALGDHLRRSISTGIHCSYTPQTSVTWEVSWEPTQT